MNFPFNHFCQQPLFLSGNFCCFIGLKVFGVHDIINAQSWITKAVTRRSTFFPKPREGTAGVSFRDGRMEGSLWAAPLNIFSVSGDGISAVTGIRIGAGDLPLCDRVRSHMVPNSGGTTEVIPPWAQMCFGRIFYRFRPEENDRRRKINEKRI